MTYSNGEQVKQKPSQLAVPENRNSNFFSCTVRD